MPGTKVAVPLLWFGGKGNMVRRLLPLIPPHRTYVEPFGGGAALLFAKPPSPLEVYNDIDSDLVNFFRVLRDPKKFARLYRLVALTPYSREEFYHCREALAADEDDVARAWRFFVLARQSFAGHFAHSWGFAVTKTSCGMADTTSKWLGLLEALPWFHARLMRVQIEHGDFRRVFELYDSEETFFYCDPPYVLETRRREEYRHEMTLADHEDLVRILLGLRGMAMLSGYAHPVYAPLEEAGWKRLEFPTACYATARTRGTGIRGKGAALARAPRVECVWLCPKTQARLAEGGALGAARRARAWRIRRRARCVRI